MSGTAIPVEIVRPKQSWPTLVGTVLGNLIGYLANAWAVMLLAPLFGAEWGYWKCVAAVVLLDALLPGNRSHLLWTRAASAVTR